MWHLIVVSKLAASEVALGGKNMVVFVPWSVIIIGLVLLAVFMLHQLRMLLLVMLVLLLLAVPLAAALFFMRSVRMETPPLVVQQSLPTRFSAARGIPMETPPAATSAPIRTPQPVSRALPAGALPSASDGPAEVMVKDHLPAWTEGPDGYVGDVYEMTAVSDPFPSDGPARADLAAKVLGKLQTYLAAIHPGADVLQSVRYDAQQLRDIPPGLMTEHVVETRTTSVGPVRIHYARLAFDGRVNRWIDDRVREARVLGRLESLGVGLGGLVALLGACWVYLKRTPSRPHAAVPPDAAAPATT